MLAQPVDPAALQPGQRTHELAAIVALIRARVIPVNRLAALIEQVGSAVRLAQLSETDRLFVRTNPTHALVGAVTSEVMGNAVKDAEEWLSRELDVRTVLDPSYPRTLHDIFDQPPLLFVQGRWIEERDSHAVAIVGARNASADGIKRARRLSRELGKAGFTVMSGLALGIDAAAHLSALNSGARTVAVMGTGIDRRYPPKNRPLADEIIASGGALVSQFFPDQPPRPWTFPMRNVVMSGLALATVVVEASSTSGARMQARIALLHGRTVFLLRSLVASHEWARKYVEEGAYETRAIEIATSEEIIERLSGNGASARPLAVG